MIGRYDNVVRTDLERHDDDRVLYICKLFSPGNSCESRCLKIGPKVVFLLEYVDFQVLTRFICICRKCTGPDLFTSFTYIQANIKSLLK